MKDDYIVRFYCGRYFNSFLKKFLDQKNINPNREFKVSGLTLEEVQKISELMAPKVYNEARSKLESEDKMAVFADGVANAFIYGESGLESGIEVFLEGKEPLVRVIDKESILNPFEMPEFNNEHENKPKSL